jgi:hypothetical protein
MVRWPRCRSGAALLAVALTAALAACAGPEATANQTAATHVTARRSAQLGPPPGSRALALASASRLLGSLRLPAGSRRMPPRPVPPGLGQPGLGFGGPGNFLDVHRLYRVPTTVARAVAFLQAHVPPGAVSSGGSGGSSADGVTSTAIAESGREVPAGIDQIHLVETLVAGPGGLSLLRADAQVLWYPPRSAAEYLVAARFRSVRITVTPGICFAAGCGVTGTSVAGGQRVIRPLAAALDWMHATPPLYYPCPGGAANYQLLFAPAVPEQPAVVVESGNCGADPVSVGGRPQPELADTGELRGLVLRLLREYERPVSSPRS